jgi:hypothetical protein
MPKTHNRMPIIQVALEVGGKRVIASALDWPGWARGGRDEQAAIDTLLAYGPRYRRAIRSTNLDLPLPTDATGFAITERLPGNATTDYGVPVIEASAEAMPVDTSDLKRLEAILHACWQAFEAAATSATGTPLRKGPRGGGREVEQIVDHVVESHFGYLRQISWRRSREDLGDLSATVHALREIDHQALTFAASGEMPAAGPRGGRLWTPRYFARRAAWHILDHAWEIEDRLPDGTGTST